MKDLSQRCLFDGNSNNLNTVMEITLDGEKYKVAISEAYEEEATPAAIKKRIPIRLLELEKKKEEMMAKIEEFKAIAEELGYDLIKKDAVKAPVKAPSRPPVTLDDKPTVQVSGTKFKMQKNTRQSSIKNSGMTQEEAVAALEAAKRGSAAQGAASSAGGEAPRMAQHTIPESAAIRTRTGQVVEVTRPEIFSKSLQTVKGRAGVPTTIPRSLQGSDGETTITIVDTGGDKTIQDRGKQLGAMRAMNDRSDYSQTCRPCQGTGFHARRQCKTCGGVGFVI